MLMDDEAFQRWQDTARAVNQTRRAALAACVVAVGAVLTAGVALMGGAEESQGRIAPGVEQDQPAELGGAVGGAQGDEQGAGVGAETEPDEPATLTATRFVVVDASGREVGELGALEGGGVALNLLDEGGALRLRVALEGDGRGNVGLYKRTGGAPKVYMVMGPAGHVELGATCCNGTVSFPWDVRHQRHIAKMGALLHESEWANPPRPYRAPERKRP